MKVKTIQAARKPQGKCERCQEEIKVGDAYKYISPRYGPKRKRCKTCPLWRQSEMTTSKMATAYVAQEDANDELDRLLTEAEMGSYTSSDIFVRDVQAAIGQAAELAEECRDEYQEGLDNMPESLQESASGESIQERIEALEEWHNSLEIWEPANPEPLDGHDFSEWAEDVVEEARSVIEELSE